MDFIILMVGSLAISLLLLPLVFAALSLLSMVVVSIYEGIKSLVKGEHRHVKTRD